MKGSGDMMITNRMPGVYRDYLMSNIRSNVAALSSVLYTLENSDFVEPEYLDESLKELERSIRQLRKMDFKN